MCRLSCIHVALTSSLCWVVDAQDGRSNAIMSTNIVRTRRFVFDAHRFYYYTWVEKNTAQLSNMYRVRPVRRCNDFWFGVQQFIYQTSSPASYVRPELSSVIFLWDGGIGRRRGEKWARLVVLNHPRPLPAYPVHAILSSLLSAASATPMVFLYPWSKGFPSHR